MSDVLPIVALIVAVVMLIIAVTKDL